jgi:haloalkane dehalogenase
MSNDISADFPYKPHYVEVLDSHMHYLDRGEGDPVVFVHGIPTWSYLWRNVIPFLTDDARCIAVDLIGMGRSEKPDIEYTVFDHIRYFEAFVEALDLSNITLVMHGWGSVIGLAYAMAHPDKIKSLAFLESHIRPIDDWQSVSLPVQELSSVLSSDDGGYDVIMHSNYYVNKVMPSGILRRLNDREMQYYQEPFQAVGSTKPIWQYLQDLPLGDPSNPVVKLITDYSNQLQQSKVPKLMMYAVPGFVTTMDTVAWAKDNLPNLSLVDVGEALHYAQESEPDVIGHALKDWYASL